MLTLCSYCKFFIIKVIMKYKIHQYCWKTCNLVTKMYNHRYLGGRVIVDLQGSKLALANLQNASDFDNLRVRKIFTSNRLWVRIIYVSQTFGESCLNATPVHSRVVVVPRGFGATVFLYMSKITFSSRGPWGPQPLTWVPVLMKTSSHRRTRFRSPDPYRFYWYIFEFALTVFFQ